MVVAVVEGAIVDDSPAIDVDVDPSPPMVEVVLLDVEVLVPGCEVDVSAAIDVEVGASVVVVVLVLVLVDVLVDDSEVDVSPAIDVEVGASVVDVEVLVDDTDVEVAPSIDVEVGTDVDVDDDVLVDVEELAPVHVLANVTDVWRVVVTLSGQCPTTVSTTEPVTVPGTVVVAWVVPEGGIGDVKPVTGYALSATAATKTSVIGRDGADSLFVMVHVST
jgi:hypothetical protein